VSAGGKAARSSGGVRATNFVPVPNWMLLCVDLIRLNAIGRGYVARHFNKE